MSEPMASFLSTLSRVLLDPSLGGRGLALSRVVSLAAFAHVTGDKSGTAAIEDMTSKMQSVLNTGRDLLHQEYNGLQSTAEQGHWWLRVGYPQRGKDGAISGGLEVQKSEPSPTPEPLSGGTAPSGNVQEQVETLAPSPTSPSSPESPGVIPTLRQAPVV